MSETKTAYLVFSLRKMGWWKPGALGYTKNRAQAARVDLEMAIRWATSGWEAEKKETPEDAIVPENGLAREGVGGYRISDDGRAIMCLRCGLTSYNLNDVENRYCGNCHQFHET